VVLLDWRLPDESGPSLCRRLSEHVPRPAIVMLTGLDDPRDRNAARKAGADDYFVKGVDPDVLAEALLQHATRGAARFDRDPADSRTPLTPKKPVS
jgi:DNA-binding response OmpR family regulator